MSNSGGNLTINSAHIATWLTLLSIIVGGFTFYGELHENYVTHEDLEILLLKRDKDRLIDEGIDDHVE